MYSTTNTSKRVDMYSTELERQNRFIELRNKGALADDWQNGAGNKPAFEFKGNRGLVLEPRHEDLEPLTDVDLDIPEAEYMMRRFCNTNTLAIGRGGKVTHYIYSGALDLKPFQNVKGDDKAHILHVRHEGKQTMWAGSVHKSGQTIEVMQDLEPLPVPPIENIRKTATAAVTARVLPESGRHEVSLALAGFLKNRGASQEDCEEMMVAAWEYHDGDVKAVFDNVEDTYENEIVTGGTTLEDLIPGLPEAISKIWGWNKKGIIGSLGESVDLGQTMKNGITPPDELTPEILAGYVTQVYAGSGMGKTWLALMEAREVMRNGGDVLYFDQENGIKIMAERLEDLGIHPDLVSARFRYYSFPGITTEDRVVAELMAAIEKYEPKLIIWDSWVNYLALDGKDENSNIDIAEWATRLISPVRERGIATILLDHTPKSGEGARGAGRKRDFVDVQYKLEGKKFDRETTAELKLKLEKDRLGWLPDETRFELGGGVFRRKGNAAADVGDLKKEIQDTFYALANGLKGEATGSDWQKMTHELYGYSKASFYRYVAKLENAGFVQEDDAYYVVSAVSDESQIAETTIPEFRAPQSQASLSQSSDTYGESQQSQAVSEGVETANPDSSLSSLKPLLRRVETDETGGEHEDEKTHEEVI